MTSTLLSTLYRGTINDWILSYRTTQLKSPSALALASFHGKYITGKNVQQMFSRYITQRIKRKPKDAPKEEEADAPDDKKPEPSKDSKKDRMDPMRHRVEEEFISEEEEEEESRSEQEIIDDLLDEEEEDDFPWEGMWDEDEDIEEVEEEEYYPSLPLGRGHR